MWLRRRRRSFWNKVDDISGDNSGASAIEFAIVAPAFLALVLGGLAWGLYLGTSHSVAQLSADAARASVAGISDQERAQIARQHIALSAADYPLVDPAKISVEAGPAGFRDSRFRVVVKYDASGLPIWFLQAFVPLPSQTLQRTAVVERGGY